MLKRLSKNNFFLNLFANLVFLSLWIIKSTSNWKGVNEQIIEKELTKKKTLIVLIWHHQLMGSTFSWKFKPKLRPIATSHRDGQLSTLVQKKFGLDPLLRKKDNPTFLIKKFQKQFKMEIVFILLQTPPMDPPKKLTLTFLNYVKNLI